MYLLPALVALWRLLSRIYGPPGSYQNPPFPINAETSESGLNIHATGTALIANGAATTGTTAINDARIKAGDYILACGSGVADPTIKIYGAGLCAAGTGSFSWGTNGAVVVGPVTVVWMAIGPS